MAGYYDLIKDYLPSNAKSDEDPRDIEVSPFWVIAVVRLSNPHTFSRDKMASFSTDSSEAAKTRANTLIISSDCSDLTIQGNKGSHIKGLSATLLGGNLNYISEISPGDWVLAWIVNDEEKGYDLIKRIKEGKACNKFDDGFKFLGRANSVHKMIDQNPSTGNRSVNYQLQAAGFRELDSSVFYDPRLAENHTGLSTWMGKLNKSINELLERETGDTNDPAALSINKTMPFFLELLVGQGISKRFSNPSSTTSERKELQIATGAGAGNAPFAYLVPKAVGDLLGRSSRDASKAGGILAYADLLEMVYGVQRYQNSSTANSDLNRYNVFIPDGIENESKHHKYTGRPMMGLFTPRPVDFSGKSVWSVLHQWLNPVVNEMYTCLRVNNNGDVVPTVIVRQLPFSTDKLANQAKNSEEITLGPVGSGESQRVKLPELTPYQELPRWKLSDTMVWRAQYGTSDALRFNFIHVYGESAQQQTNNNLTYQLVRNPPIRDDLDIQRSGLRPYMTTVACSYKETKIGPRAWMELVADILIGQQLTLTGSIQSIGIQAPICEGDNLEFDGCVFHIEGYTHRATKDLNGGRKSFTTTLNLTHGMRSDKDSNYSYDKELRLYPGILPEDQTKYDPGFSYEGDSNAFTPEEQKKYDQNFQESLQKDVDRQTATNSTTNFQAGRGQGVKP